MYSRCERLRIVASLAALACAAFANGASGPAALRVCADPNNLPFSNEREQGFENAIARLIAADLDRPLEYTWWPQRRGFIRNTLRAGRCDLVIGAPLHFELARTTAPYYRSTYVFVTRAHDELRLRSLDDPRLKKLRIGLHAIGDDYSNVPPAQALAQRGIIENVRGYSIYGDYSRPDPPRDLIDAVARREIDVAIAWGPLAGYFATREPIPLRIDPVAQPPQGEQVPMSFDIAMAVRRKDVAFADELNRFIARRRAAIEATLREYGVPLLEPRPVHGQRP
jgi:quinoprotein dehydrogenase-associated probable ABC transporter substrate-binding protein